jgi:hypothetical protein
MSSKTLPKDRILSIAELDHSIVNLAARINATTSRTPELAGERWSAQQADALVTVANAFLAGNSEQVTSVSDNYQVTVHVDQ